jgi:large subunit ribosomal protein L10Ae
MKVLPRLVGNVLVKIGKFPIAIPENETVASKVSEVKSSVKYAVV